MQMAETPPVPKYVLRGHASPIHALHFFASNELLASGDSDGWLVVWRLSSKRPVAVWKGHDGGVMQIRRWTDQRLITHGRDHKLRVWKVHSEDFEQLSTKLPDEAAPDDQAQPWLLHSMPANALNFCAFSTCSEDPEVSSSSSDPSPQLIASPNGLDSGGIDIFQLPSEKRVSQLRSDPAVNTGMVMAVGLSHETRTSKLVLVSGYEDGQVMVHTHSGALGGSEPWAKIFAAKPHSQPVLSLVILPSNSQFITSGADAIVTKYSLADLGQRGQGDSMSAGKNVNTKHAGQQGLSARSDGKLVATSGWDGRIRVYSCKTMKELAVLKWHKDGCYATDFAEIDPDPSQNVGHGNATAVGQNTDFSTRMTALDLIKQEREARARSTHWLAAGGKDAKITLWEVY